MSDLITKYPSDILGKDCLSAFSLSEDEILDLIAKMRRAAWDVNALGISAPQVGEPYRAFGIFNPDKVDFNWFFDPEIVSMEGSAIFNEGCLSIPNYFWPVKRPDKIYARWSDVQGKKHGKTMTGIMSRVYQHEMDHIDGLCIPDFLDDQQFMIFWESLEEPNGYQTYEAPELWLDR